MEKILITSIGRTGTKSLAYFLDDISGVQCFHHKEGNKDLPFLFLSQLKDYSNITTDYLKKRNKVAEKAKTNFYIEVNPYFRFANTEILQKLGWKKIFIVRHPKSYLESVYKRTLFTDEDYIINQYPNDDDPFSEKWNTITRFEKLCWCYKKVHEHILDTETPFYRFEDLVKKPDTLKSLVETIGIDTSKINSFKLPKRNTSKQNKFRHVIKAGLRGKATKVSPLIWSSLTAKEKETYETHCLPLAKRLGYVL